MCLTCVSFTFQNFSTKDIANKFKNFNLEINFFNFKGKEKVNKKFPVRFCRTDYILINIKEERTKKKAKRLGPLGKKKICTIMQTNDKITIF